MVIHCEPKTFISLLLGEISAHVLFTNSDVDISRISKREILPLSLSSTSDQKSSSPASDPHAAEFPFDQVAGGPIRSIRE
jgi:hypothetical protein